jgi:hypothetical protein
MLCVRAILIALATCGGIPGCTVLRVTNADVRTSYYPGIAIIKVQPSAHTASVLSIKGAGLTMGTRGATLGHLKEITFSAPDQLACRTFIVVETDEQARLIQALLQSPNDLQALYLIKEP